MHPAAFVFDKSEGERKVFTALERALPNAYHAIHHVPLLKKRSRGGAVDDEIDFVIVHPQAGVLILEVKGGLVRYEPSTGKWWSGESAIRNPFDEVTDAKFGLINWLHAQPGWRVDWGPFGHAVMFPDGVYRGAPMPNVDHRLVFDADDIADPKRFRTRLEDAYSLWKAERELGVPGCDFVVKSIVHSVSVTRRPGDEIEGPDQEIIRLSPQQYGVLNAFLQVPRASIAGPAGAGKTLIALEAARRLAAQGKRILLTCFNKELATHLVAEHQASFGSAVTIKTFTQLCVDRAKQVGFRLPAQPWKQEDFDAIHASLDETVTMGTDRFDAIVVDEGQDFAASWWPSLELLLSKSDTDRMYVFYDSNQGLFHRPQGLPKGVLDLHLYESWRNTHQIFGEVMRHYQGEPITPMGPKNGVAVEHKMVTKASLSAELGRILHHVIVDGKTSPRDVVVLTGVAVDKSRARGACGRFNLCLHPTGRNDVTLTNVFRFKGLDSKVVILCEIDPINTAAMYVACSRARALLIILDTTS